MPAVKTCLWFRAEAEEAARHYVAIFPSSRIVNVLRAGDSAIAVDFEIDGQPVLALNGRPETGFTDAQSATVTRRDDSKTATADPAKCANDTCRTQTSSAFSTAAPVQAWSSS